MIKAHKIRINPTPEQEAQLWQAANNARFTFNWVMTMTLACLSCNKVYEVSRKGDDQWTRI